MSFQFSASRILHDEHMASIALMSEVERLIVRRAAPPSPGDGETAAVARRLASALRGEITAHFEFEERVLFPYLMQCGEGDLAELLTEEHLALYSLFDEIETTIGDLREDSAAVAWRRLRSLCGELSERLQSHIEKEERALLPALEGALTQEVDAELSARHDL
ncbi:MAG: hemerythrin domain-containing protein [Hyphomicrobiales bacterium]|nr:hemerythrin domain-containing protein [Hyphomicrobiales bacterium]